MTLAVSEMMPKIYNRVSQCRNQQHGMSLIEVILAIAIAGFLLASATSLLVSISSIWSDYSERHFFTDHVDGVTEFLNATLAASGTEIISDSAGSDDGSSGNREEEQALTDEDQFDESPQTPQRGGSLMTSPDEPIRWERPPGFANYREPLLNFSMTETPPILVGLENTPPLGINAFLYFEADEGLSLLWHSILQEEVEDINDLRRTLISPLVKKITYIYWDERFEAWEEEERPQENDEDDQYKLPRFIKLVFEHEGETKERILTIPVPSKSAVIF